MSSLLNVCISIFFVFAGFNAHADLRKTVQMFHSLGTGSWFEIGLVTEGNDLRAIVVQNDIYEASTATVFFAPLVTAHTLEHLTVYEATDHSVKIMYDQNLRKGSITTDDHLYSPKTTEIYFDDRTEIDFDPSPLVKKLPCIEALK